MTSFSRLTGLGLLLCLSTITAMEPVCTSTKAPGHALHVTIIYDNYQSDSRLASDWGFASLVECDGQKLLFDAGRNADLYRKNAELLEIRPQEIPSLFISHEHGDHTAGIPWITTVNPSVNCYLPASYANQLRSGGRLPKNSTAISGPMHLYGPFYSTGENFELFKEQGLIVLTGRSGVLITGCGHPGVVEMVRVAEEELGIGIGTVIGGLHLMETSEKGVKEIADALKAMGVQQICPTHCTGDRSIALLKESFGEGYLPGGTGRVITIE
jgi:7,8-dihydropterin-6-yl-methyl-4-(beta-D-ribofuranosyl)aminobenzene 5'-phosphate synthase